MKELENLVDEASQKKSTYFDAYSEMSTDISLKKKIWYTGFSANSGSCGMDLTSGVFTAPVAGAYFLTFTGVKSDDSKSFCSVQMMVGDNENRGENVAAIATGLGVGTAEIAPLPLQAIVNMKKGQKAWVQFNHDGSLFSFHSRLTHFTGVLISAE